MMVGLQGTGKTTTVGKLALHLMNRHHKRPLLVAADVYRPAAIDQLKVLGERLGMPVYAEPGGSPPDICEQAHEAWPPRPGATWSSSTPPAGWRSTSR